MDGPCLAHPIHVVLEPWRMMIPMAVEVWKSEVWKSEATAKGHRKP